MIKIYDQIDKLNDLSYQLLQAINQQNFDKARLLAIKQNKLIDKLAIASDASRVLDKKGDWQSALEGCQTLRKALQSELKKLNTDTRNSLKRLKGYSR